MAFEVTAGADTYVFGAGKVKGTDFVNGLFDSFFQRGNFGGSDGKFFAVKGTGLVRLDKVKFGFGNFVRKRPIKLSQ